MTPGRWQQIKVLFDGAVDLGPEARDQFLQRECGDDAELRSEVEALLSSDASGASTHFKSPVSKAAAIFAAAPASPDLLTEAYPPRPDHPTLKNRYKIIRELGRGGMSVVYFAHDLQLLDKPVVVKVLLDKTNSDPYMRQKFQQEMEALARIDHPAVVGALDYGLNAEGQQFLVMQFIDGTTLRDAINPGGMETKRAVELIGKVAQALSSAHAKGVWHRDLKPENVMIQKLGREEHVKVIDFGIAGIQNSQFGGEDSKIAGTMTYMAPEQFAGHACAASDTYALGVVAFELLTGEKPFPPNSLTHLVAEDKSPETKLESLRQDAPDGVKRAILKAMAFGANRRYAEIGEFGEELQRAFFDSLQAQNRRTPSSPGGLEIAHVLFTDLIGYSLLSMDDQKEYLAQFQAIVRGSQQFREADEAGNLINLPTGDGMALAFFGDPSAPAKCALEIAEALKIKSHLKLRMGIHSGPVYRVADMNANANVSGGGINMAQRVMDSGDSGHILLSRNVAEVLEQLRGWKEHLTDLGAHEVKHGVKVHFYNLCKDGVGNPAMPRKLAQTKVPPKPVSVNTLLIAGGLTTVMVLGLGGYVAWDRAATEKAAQKATLAAAEAAKPKHILRYFVMVQKVRDKVVIKQPSRLAGERIFDEDNQIRFTFSNPEPGHLYIVNEGPKSTDEVPDLNCLAVETLKANQPFNIPSGNYISFDKEQGKEKLWLVWSPTPLPQMESLKRLRTTQLQGVVGDRAEAKMVLQFLKKAPQADKSEEESEQGPRTLLKSPADILVRLIPLDHL